MSVQKESFRRTKAAALAVICVVAGGCDPQVSETGSDDGESTVAGSIGGTDSHLSSGNTDFASGRDSGSSDVPRENVEEAAPKEQEVTRTSERYIVASSLEEALAIFEEMDRSGPLKKIGSSYSYDISPCNLHASSVYLRKSSGYKSVGSKPYTKCKYPVTSISHVTGIDYRSWLWWNSAGPDSKGGNRGVSSYTQRDVAYRCSSLEENTFRGTTFGIVVFQGETYYSRVHTPTRELGCEI